MFDASISSYVTYLGRSKDGLNDWETLARLDNYSSSPKVALSDHSENILLAYEASPPDKHGHNLVIKHYQTLEHMVRNSPENSLTFDRTLSQVTEGTPSFEKVQFSQEGLYNSNFTIRFHYLDRDGTEKQAIGVYEGKRAANEEGFLQRWFGCQTSNMTPHPATWTATSEDEVNKKLIKMGFHGDLGSRKEFDWNGTRYHLLEAQECKGCHGRWCIVLTDAKMMPIAKLPMITPTKISQSFTSPNILKTDDNRYLVSLFLPT